MTEEDQKAMISDGTLSGQSSEMIPSGTPAVTSAPYSEPGSIPERLNGLCSDNTRAFGSTSATALVQGIVNEKVKKAERYESQRDELVRENTELKVRVASLEAEARTRLGGTIAIDILMGLGFAGIGASISMDSNRWVVGGVAALLVIVSFLVKYVIHKGGE